MRLAWLVAAAALLGCGKRGRDAAGASATAAAAKPGEPASRKAQAGGGQKDGGATDANAVRIEPDAQQRAGIQVEPAQERVLPRTLRVAGQVQLDEQHTSHVGVRAAGVVTAVRVLAGDKVLRGQTLATLHSHEVHETAGALAQAYADLRRQQGALAFAQKSRARYQHLYSIEAASLEEAQRAGQELQQAKSLLANARASVRMETEHLAELLQVPPGSITPETLYAREEVPVRAPSDGTVISRNVTVGQVADAGFEAFTVSDLSTVWVTASVDEKNLSLLRTDVKALVTTQGFPNVAFEGLVTTLGSTLDPRTRTLPVRVRVPNTDLRLRPGMFATVEVAEAQTERAVFVPDEAIQDINGMQVVFTTKDGATFSAQTVKLGLRDNGRAEVLEGVKGGDRVVTAGAFTVKAELLKGSMREG